MESDNGKTGEKDCTFHHTVEMKQSHVYDRACSSDITGGIPSGVPRHGVFHASHCLFGAGCACSASRYGILPWRRVNMAQELLQFLLLSRDSFRISKPAVAKLFPREWYLPKFSRRGAALRRVMGRRSLRPRCAGYRPAGASCGQVSERRRIARDSLSAGARGILPMRGYLSCRWRTCCADTL